MVFDILRFIDNLKMKMKIVIACNVTFQHVVGSDEYIIIRIVCQ